MLQGHAWTQGELEVLGDQMQWARMTYEDWKEVISKRIADLTEAEKEEKERIVAREVTQEKNAA